MSARSDTAGTIETYYNRFNSGDMKGFFSLLADDVVHEINQGGVEKGKDAFVRFMQRMNEHYREQVVDLVVFASDDGKRAAAEFKVRGVYLKTDPGLPEARSQEYLLPVGAFFEVEAGRIKRVTNYYNLEAWLGMVK